MAWAPSSFVGTKLEWTRAALLRQENLGSPLHRVLTIAKHVKELTPASEKITSNALRAILAPIPLGCLMDVADAKDCILHVEDKVVARAAKRKAAAEAAAAAKEARLMEMGRKRAAKRAAIASRPPSATIRVDNSLRVHRM